MLMHIMILLWLFWNSNLTPMKAAVMTKLNAITDIDIKYKRTIKSWRDLYHEKNNKDSHTTKPAAVP
jgi:hypothetical protein